MLMNQHMFIPLNKYRGALMQALIIEDQTGESFLADHLIKDFVVLNSGDMAGAICKFTRKEIIAKHGGLIKYDRLGL